MEKNIDIGSYAQITTKRIRVYGIVQGVGFRPTVSRHAEVSGIRGSVCNCGPYVEIIAQGSDGQVDLFLKRLERRPPARAAILKIDIKDADAQDRQKIYDSFEIIESAKTKGEIFISPDIAICDDCKREIFDRKDRRYLHPFINCTSCGPRMTILDLLPYDRERTSMAEFPMCPDCAEEYHDPGTRRYDAQPVCCPECGPQVYELVIGEGKNPIKGISGPSAITQARRVISSGGIIAVKGIGGFHLCCDATNPDAVSLLRQRKKRPVKPFAVMVKDISTAARECEFTRKQEKIMTGHQKPIMLLKKKSQGMICQETAPGNPKLGVMLPYAPVQLLLFEYDDDVKMPDCLVMTSANASGAPICRSDEDAAAELSDLCDFILSNDRKIRIRADDTVMDFFDDRPYMIRRSRGYAPLPFMSSEEEKGCALAIGGELKNSFCIGVNGLYYPSPYVGDLADLRTVKALRETSRRFEDLLEAQPEIIACDKHPGYNSTAYAKELSKERNIPLFEVQHHYAHILSCMAENDERDRVIGVAFDGTGYGEDGSIWGGEILLCDTDGYERVGSIDEFTQCGGDLSAKEGWRIAVSMLLDMLDDDLEKTIAAVKKLGLCDDQQVRMTAMMKSRGINSVKSTSAGRLFDAVSALLGIRLASGYEGEASMFLQFAAERGQEYSISDSNTAQPGMEKMENSLELSDCISSDNEAAESDLVRLDTSGIFRRLAQTLLEKIENDDTDSDLNEEFVERLAFRFHRELAEETLSACCRVGERTGCSKVALSGGVFQNTLLLRLTLEMLKEKGFTVLTHSMLPPNDGGIALGQAYAAMNELRKRQ